MPIARNAAHRAKIQPPFYPCDDNLVCCLCLAITLWVTRVGIPPLNPLFCAEFPGSFVVELSPVIRYKGLRDTKACDNVFPKELDNIRIVN